MNDKEKEVVKEALDSQMRKETFEHAMGRAMRRRGLTYEQYVEVMSQIRETARKSKTKIEEAARFLVSSQEEDA